MAESFNAAFGRYLRTLRERRGLAMSEVVSLSRVFPDPVAKGYLSHCENGRHRLSASKMIALSRIYEVPPQVLLERMELDLELERLGGPKTEGLGFVALRNRGTRAFHRGQFWDAYGFFRDSAAVVPKDKADPGYRDPDEQLACGYLIIAGMAAMLGRRAFALYELEYLKGSGTLEPRHHVMLLDWASIAFRLDGRLDEAQVLADETISQAASLHLDEILGYAYASRAAVAQEQGDFKLAIELHQKAFRAHKNAGFKGHCARALFNLGAAYLKSGQIAAARRGVRTALRLARSLGQTRTIALAHVLYGDIESRSGRPGHADRHWRVGADMARGLSDRMTRFRAEFRLYKSALERQDTPVVRSIERRLRRRLPWVAGTIEEAEEYARMINPGTDQVVVHGDSQI